MFELYEQLLPLYACQTTHTDTTGKVLYRLCNKAPESVAHVLAGCTTLAQTKYTTRHNAALAEDPFLRDFARLRTVDSVPPWYSLLKPKPVYESNNTEAFWDVPLFAEHQEVRANRVDARIINHVSKRVITLEMNSFKGYKSGEKEGGENHEIRIASQRIKAEVSRI